MRILPFIACLFLCAPAMAAPVRVCLVGDSITKGYAPATRDWGVELRAINAGEDFGVKNLAESGYTVSQAGARVDTDILGRGCTWVAFLIGTNDLSVGTSAATIYAAIDALMDAAEADGANTLGLAILPRGTYFDWTSDIGTRLLALNALLDARTSSTPGRRYVFVDTYTALLEPESDPPALATAAGGATDGLHPSNAGQDLIADEVQEAVESAGGW